LRFLGWPSSSEADLTRLPQRSVANGARLRGDNSTWLSIPGFLLVGCLRKHFKKAMTMSCVHLTGPQGAMMFGETLFLGVLVGVFPDAELVQMALLNVGGGRENSLCLTA
jgi:hypothetical protein